MKTQLLSIVLFLLFLLQTASAQNTESAKTSFGILGGVNIQNFNGKDNSGDKLENKMIIGYHVGINIQIPIAPDFYFQPGLSFSTKGSENTELSITSTYNLSYIEMPLNLVYKAMLGNGYVMVGFGPYIGYAIGGKATFEGGPILIEADVEFKNEVAITDPLTVAYFKALDAGGNIFAGYEFANGIFFQINTQLGMLRINPEDNRSLSDELLLKNTGFGLSLGYRF